MVLTILAVANGAGLRWMPADTLHWGACAAVCFARGVDDNGTLPIAAALAAVAAGILMRWM